MLQRDTARLSFRRSSPHRSDDFCRFAARDLRIYLGPLRLSLYSVSAVAVGRPVFSKRLQDVYRIIRVSGRSSERDAERTRAVIAAGFFHAADARECAVRWLKRYCPEATYLPDSGRWRVQDEDGSIHLFCIEPTAADERTAA
jgi:hypothetical protein